MTRALHLAFVAEIDGNEKARRIASRSPSIMSRIRRLVRKLLSLPRTPMVISNKLTEIRHMRTLAELRDLEMRRETLCKEIHAANLELMRLSGKEAMTRHKLRTM